ncbi:MAG: thioredoxin family protein [Armatimonadota bacterium]
MKNTIIKLFSAAIITVAIILAVPALTAEKKPVTKVKSGAICPTPIPKTASVKKKQIVKAPVKQAKKVSTKLPRLLDLGATKCIPCKMMAPILKELAKEYKGKLKVDFIDVWENEGVGQKYKIKTIPTQIFYDANGKELYRHIGFYSKEDILAKFKELGIILKK